MPSISSLFTFSPRPIVLPLGGAFRRAAAIRSLRPSSRPALCGPRSPLPPENATRSKPMPVLPQVLDRRHIGRGVVERRHVVLLAEPDELHVLDPAFLVVVVVEEHHRGLVGDRALQILGRLDFDELHAAVADGVVVAEAVRFLDDDLALHTGGDDVGEVDDLPRVGAGEHAGGAERQRRGGAGGDHRRLALEQRREPLADLVVQLVEHHALFGRVGDRVDHFGRHQRGGHRGVGAGRVDEGTDADLTKIIARSLPGRCRRRRPRADQPAHDRQRRDGLQKSSSAPHDCHSFAGSNLIVRS